MPQLQSTGAQLHSTNKNVNEHSQNSNQIQAISSDQCKIQLAGDQSESKCLTFLKTNKKKIIIVSSIFLVILITLSIVLPLTLNFANDQSNYQKDQHEFIKVYQGQNDSNFFTSNLQLGSGHLSSKCTSYNHKNKCCKEVLNRDLQIMMKECPQNVEKKENTTCYVVLVPLDIFIIYINEQENIKIEDFLKVYNSDPQAFWHHHCHYIKNKLTKDFKEWSNHEYQKWKVLDSITIGEIEKQDYVDIILNQSTKKFELDLHPVASDEEKGKNKQENNSNKKQQKIKKDDQKLQSSQQIYFDTNHEQQIAQLEAKWKDQRGEQKEEKSENKKADKRISTILRILKRSIREMRNIICAHLSDIKRKSQKLQNKLKQLAEEQFPKWAQNLIENCYFLEQENKFRCKLSQINKIVPSINTDKISNEAVITNILEIALYEKKQ